MPTLDRITRNPEIMGGKPCIRGMRVTAGTLVGLVASGHSNADIIAAYPYLQEEDIRQSLAYTAWRVDEIEIPIPAEAQSKRRLNPGSGCSPDHNGQSCRSRSARCSSVSRVGCPRYG